MNPIFRHFPQRSPRAMALLIATALAALVSIILPVQARPGSALSEGEAILGPAPRTSDPAELAPSIFPEPRAQTAAIVNTGDRAAVVNAYNSRLVPALAVPSGWTGNLATCNAGTTSSAYEAATLDAINYFRAMAGLPDTITFNSTLSAKDQQAALMMNAQGELSHFPPPSFACYTADGADAASKSNIAIGIAGAAAVAGYIEDSGANNTAVGHRRWLLYPPQAVMGTGSTTGVKQVVIGGQTFNINGGNAIWVIGNTTTRPATPEFVAWPPAGYVPRQVTYARWSFSVNRDAFGPGAPSFAGATVAMTRNGQNVPVAMLPQDNSTSGTFGDFTIAWEPQGLNHFAGMPDTTYHVVISNVIVGGTARTFAYDVTVIDPGAVLVPTPTPTNPVSPSFGGKAFSISAGPTGVVNETWAGGTAQLGYLLLRLDMVGGGSTLLPPGGIPAGQTSYSDTSFPAAGGVYCYILLPYNAAGVQRSDMLCVFRNTRTPTGAPENFTLRLNQSSTASLTWSQPIGGGQTGYTLNVLNAAAPPPISLGPGDTSRDVAITGPTCFRLEAVGRGASDVLCAFPGVSSV